MDLYTASRWHRLLCGIWKKNKKNLVGCVVLPSGWQMVPRQPDQQAATQCSPDPTEMWANAFSKWPLLLYLITERSVNLKLMLVCHGEAHLARVGELPAAGCLSLVPHLEPCSSGVGARQRQLSWPWLENIAFFVLPFPSAWVRLYQVFFCFFWGGESFFFFF